MRPRLARTLGTEASKLEPGPVAGFGFPDDTSGVSDWVSPVGCYLPVRGRGCPADTTCPVPQRPAPHIAMPTWLCLVIHWVRSSASYVRDL